MPVREQDRKAYVERYTERLARHGETPEALGWGLNPRQDVRFGVLAEPALGEPSSSVLDVGCGFADLFDFLGARGWRGRYTGIDIVPALIERARRRHPELDLRERDITDEAGRLEPADFVVASGVFNARLEAEDNPSHIQQALACMLELARVAVCADFLSTRVDFQKLGAWHTEPGWALEAGLRLSPRAVLRHDYMPYEFALFIYKDASRDERGVFRARTPRP